MNLLATQVRAGIVQDYMAGAFVRHGFKTEGRLLKVQSSEVLALVKKAIDEMPAFGPFEALEAALSWSPSAPYHEKRRHRGKHYERIGKAEKTMLKTLRKAFDSLYRTHNDWTRREQINATSRMMKAVIDTPRKKAKALMDAETPPE
jgi:hypothetical protein